MRLKVLLPCLTVALLAAAGMTIWSGCETGSADETIYIDPASVVLQKGEFADFTASGGYEYTWSLVPDDGSGKLNVRHGGTVTFELMSDTASTPIHVVVWSTIPGTPTSGSGTNSDTYAKTATALVYIRSVTNGPTSTLEIHPTSASLIINHTLELWATGGSGTYKWSCTPASPTGGTLSTNYVSTVTFTAPPTAMDTAVNVTDDLGVTKSCVINVTLL